MTHREFIWRWQCKLTRWNLPENSLGHEILKALSIERRPMNGNCILKVGRVRELDGFKINHRSESDNNLHHHG